MASKGYKLVPIAPGEKYPKVKAWQDAATDDLATVAGWTKGSNGVGWAMGNQPNGMHLFALDIDGEIGGDSFIRLVSAHPESVDTFKRTVQQVTGSDGAHYIFQAPFEVRNSAQQFAEKIDIRGEGGQIVVGPTIHPNGRPYRWIANPIDVEPLMAPEWVLERIEEMGRSEMPSGISERSLPVKALYASDVPRGTTDHPIEWANDVLSPATFLNEQGWQYMETRGQDQYWCRPGKNPRDGHSAVLHPNGALVVFTTELDPYMQRLGKPTSGGAVVLTPFDVYCAYGHRGDVKEAMATIRRQMMPQGVASALPATARAETPAEGAAHAVDDSLNLPDEFWESREWLSHIRKAAWSRGMSPDSALGAIITRFATVIPPGYQIPAIVGAPSTFDHLSILITESSGGKSSSVSIARELFEGPTQRKDIVWDIPVPSGEGLVQQFFEFIEETVDGKKTKVNRKTKTAVHFSIDETMALIEAGGRQGATIGSVLITAWSGGNPGQSNATAERNRQGMNPFTYRVAGLGAIQTSLAHELLSDKWVRQGLSGRLVFFAAEDPNIPDPDNQPPWPGPINFPVPPTLGLHTIEYAKEIRDEVRWAHYRRTKKEAVEAPIDGHLRLVKLKLSGIFALMEGRGAVTVSDWELASVVVATHLQLRNHILSVSRELQRDEGHRRAEAAAHFEDTRDSLKERRLIAAMRDRIIAKVPEEGLARNPLRKLVSSGSTKDRFPAALEAAMNDGKVVEREERFYPA